MATRGTAILITDDYVATGPEFNGDMYPDGHGDYFLDKLSDVDTNVDFIKFNNHFNKYYFGYEQIMSQYQGKYDNDVEVDGVYSVNDIMNHEGVWITSDWVFIKNKTSEPITLKDMNGKNVELEIDETIRLYFGKLVDNGVGHKIKK